MWSRWGFIYPVLYPCKKINFHPLRTSLVPEQSTENFFLHKQIIVRIWCIPYLRKSSVPITCKTLCEYISYHGVNNSTRCPKLNIRIKSILKFPSPLSMSLKIIKKGQLELARRSNKWLTLFIIPYVESETLMVQKSADTACFLVAAHLGHLTLCTFHMLLTVKTRRHSLWKIQSNVMWTILCSKVKVSMLFKTKTQS